MLSKFSYNVAMEKFCKHCSNEIVGRDVRATVCFNCTDKTYKITGGLAASRDVRQAIKKNLLANPTNFMCVDCGVPATCYDHRDYNKPLEVEPVCSRCNVLRGSAIPKVTS
jgi:hypothetical protein